MRRVRMTKQLATHAAIPQRCLGALMIDCASTQRISNRARKMR
jgi:hypothetical protein